MATRGHYGMFIACYFGRVISSKLLTVMRENIIFQWEIEFGETKILLTVTELANGTV